MAAPAASHETVPRGLLRVVLRINFSQVVGLRQFFNACSACAED
jgi:hypothetical protein